MEEMQSYTAGWKYETTHFEYLYFNILFWELLNKDKQMWWNYTVGLLNTHKVHAGSTTQYV